MYRRDWALARMGAAPNRMLFAAENRGEESGIVGPWKAVTEPEAGGCPPSIPPFCDSGAGAPSRDPDPPGCARCRVGSLVVLSLYRDLRSIVSFSAPSTAEAAAISI